MERIVYKDKIASRGRYAWLLLIKGDDIFPFEGESIPEVVVVLNSEYVKQGKWSYTEYTLGLADNIRTIQGHAGWNTGMFLEGLASALHKDETPIRWIEVADMLGVSVHSAMKLLREWKPLAAEQIDRNEELLAALDDSEVDVNSDVQIIKVNFGHPTNRSIREGFWTAPKSLPDEFGGELVLKDPDNGWTKDNIKLTGIAGEVLNVVHARGPHGGYYTVTVAVAVKK